MTKNTNCAIIVTERKREVIIMTNTFTILTKTRNITFKRHNGCMVYTGTVYMEHGVESKEVFLNALDAHNYGGTVEFRRTAEPNVFTYTADVYFD